MMDNSCSSLENFLHTVGYLCFFLVPVILLPIGAIHGPEVLYNVGFILFFFPFILVLLIRSVRSIPVVGAPLADIVVTILRIMTHDLCMILNHVASLPGAVEHPYFICIIRNLCHTFHFQRNEVVAEEALPSCFPFIRNNGVVVAETEVVNQYNPVNQI